MSHQIRHVVERYWALMNGNDVGAVGALLADDFVLVSPQPGERVRDRERNAQINERYPSPGPRHFTLDRLLVDSERAVTDVRGRGAAVEARAISCFELRDGRIQRITAYWPEPFPAPEWRAEWAEPIT